jgi:hypothetical protein
LYKADEENVEVWKKARKDIVEEYRRKAKLKYLQFKISCTKKSKKYI